MAISVTSTVPTGVCAITAQASVIASKAVLGTIAQIYPPLTEDRSTHYMISVAAGPTI
jgi:hypothetical protein